MTEYNPDRWLVLKIELNGEIVYKVFGTWHGGYLDGDSWRANSGIKEVSVDGNFILFHGESGSIYRCHKDTYGASAWSHSVLRRLIENTDSPVTILDEDTDWISLKGNPTNIVST